jgi:hypothetical protein
VFGPKRDDVSHVQIQALSRSRITVENAKIVEAGPSLHDDPKSIDAAINDAVALPRLDIE